MKKIIVLVTAGFIICTAFNTPAVLIPESNGTARTYKSLCTDYRDAYVGNYFCHSTFTYLVARAGAPPNVTKDTGTINVSKDPIDSILQIAIGSYINKFKLKSGVMYSYPVGGRRGGKFFAADSISLAIINGQGSTYQFIGKKK